MANWSALFNAKGEYAEFLSWYRKQFGTQVEYPTLALYKTLPEYKFWIANSKPTDKIPNLMISSGLPPAPPLVKPPVLPAFTGIKGMLTGGAPTPITPAGVSITPPLTGKTAEEAAAEMNRWLNTRTGIMNPPTSTTPTPTTATSTLGTVKVETINGVLGVASYDPDGRLTNFEPISSSTVARDWTAETLTAQAARDAEDKRRWDIEQARLSAIEAGKPEIQRATNEAQFERDRYSLLQGIAPDDWITRYMMENQPNPYKAQTSDTAMADLEKGLDQRTADVQYRQQILSGAIMGGADDDTIAKLKDLRDQASAKRDVYYDAWKTQKTEQKDWTPQTYPNAPAWLPKYALGQVAGKMITPEDVVTPSGQQLTQMPTTEASRLGYYADWSQKLGGGRNWKDILGEVRLMQPETPRGAGSFGWSPAGR